MAQREVREGVTYQSSICLTNSKDIDFVSIPAQACLPEIQRIPSSALSSSVLCLFDLETTSLNDTCDLVQLSAKLIGSDCEFNCYILPDVPISRAASRITCLTKNGNSLFCRGKMVSSVSLVEGLEDITSNPLM